MGKAQHSERLLHDRNLRLEPANFSVNNQFSEHFPQTLYLFDKMLPEFFSGAKEASQSKTVLTKRESSKTAHNAGFTNETRAELEKGLLRYEMDLYNLCKAIFYRRLKFHGIEL